MKCDVCGVDSSERKVRKIKGRAVDESKSSAALSFYKNIYSIISS